MSDLIFIKRLLLESNIGIYDWEKAKKQILFLDIEMKLDISEAVKCDSVEKTVNYELVAEKLREFAAKQSTLLLETLSDKIAQFIFDEFPAIAWVRLRLGKSKAFSVIYTDEVGVVIERHRGSTA